MPGITPVALDATGRLSAEVMPLEHDEGLVPNVAALGRSSAEVVATSFRSGHGFARTTGSATAVDDVATFLLGSQSFKTPTVSDGVAQKWQKLSIGPFDFSAKNVVVALRVSDVAKFVDCKLYLSSDNITANFGYFDFMGQGSTYKPIQSGEWVLFTIPRGAFVQTGTINWAAINSVQLFVSSAAGQQADAWWNLIAARPEPAAGVVSLTFDDGWLEQFTNARAKLDQYRMAATAYPICERIDQATAGEISTFMTLAHLRELEKFHGWELGLHGSTQLQHDKTLLSVTDVQQEIVAMKHWHALNGFSLGRDHMAYPLGAYDLTMLPTLRKYLRSGRTTAIHQQETIPPYDPHRLRVYAPGGATPAATIVAEIDKAIANKSWLILLFHRITPSVVNNVLDYSIANFATVVDYLASSGVAVKTVGEALRQPVT